MCCSSMNNVPNVSPWSRDEYSFASTLEGGKGSWVGHVSRREQRVQGGMLSRFYREQGLKAGDQFRVTVGK